MWEKQKRHTFLVKIKKINNKTLITSSNQGFIFNYKFAFQLQQLYLIDYAIS
jgi:hypothetical protein